MKTLIVSDLHLTHSFDEKKFFFLEKLFSSYDQIILNGDFWDGYVTTFDRFISSRWSKLFPILKKKNAIYLYGNHDQKKFSDDRSSLFSSEQKNSYEFTINDTKYLVEHGHTLCPSIDMMYSLSRHMMLYVMIASHLIENILVRLRSPQNIIINLANNNIIKKLRRKNMSHWYICGHTHCAEIDAPNKFANSGFIQYGKATYLIADSSGVTLHTEWYK